MAQVLAELRVEVRPGVHAGIECSESGMKPIEGNRYDGITHHGGNICESEYEKLSEGYDGKMGYKGPIAPPIMGKLKPIKPPIAAAASRGSLGRSRLRGYAAPAAVVAIAAIAAMLIRSPPPPPPEAPANGGGASERLSAPSPSEEPVRDACSFITRRVGFLILIKSCPRH